MYLGIAEGESRKTTESWKADAERIGDPCLYWFILRCCSFNDPVSILDIRQNTQDTSSFYLAGTYTSLVPTQFDPIFRVPSLLPHDHFPTSLWNGLGFLNLVISITCALIETLLRSGHEDISSSLRHVTVYTTQASSDSFVLRRAGREGYPSVVIEAPR
ncbi:hypothetical protein EI94DRAFT_435169 [Lactarius quietus]|nr:hypothetical protein EI94DRAFT_435169 [Lactarius quietus]